MIVAIGAYAQQSTKVKSRVLADSIWVPKGARECTNIVVTPKGDTARSVYYEVSFKRDTSLTSYISLSYYDKNGGLITQDNVSVPGAVYTKWNIFVTLLDTYIQNQRPRIILH